MLTIDEANLLVGINKGSRSLKQLQQYQFDSFGELPNVSIGMLLMRLEQAKLIHGVGLPKSYALLKEGDLALSKFKSKYRKMNLALI